MKCLKSFSILIFAALLSIGSSAYAAQIESLNVTMNETSKTVIISGAISTGKAKKVTLIITDPENDPEYVRQTISEENGLFSFQYKMLNTRQGLYHVAVGGEGVTSIVYGGFTYSGLPDVILPIATIDTTSTEPDAMIFGVQSTKLGMVYLVPEGNYEKVDDLLAIDAAYRSQANVEEADVSFAIRAPSREGTYRLYAVDLDDNLSVPSAGIVTVISSFNLVVNWNVGDETNTTTLIGGKMLTANVSASTLLDGGQVVTLLVTLHDSDGVVMKYAALPVVLEMNETQHFNGEFRLPRNVSGYEARVSLVSGHDLYAAELVCLTPSIVITE